MSEIIDLSKLRNDTEVEMTDDELLNELRNVTVLEAYALITATVALLDQLQPGAGNIIGQMATAILADLEGKEGGDES